MDELKRFYEGKSVAILGGSGMLGSYIADILLECNAKVENYDIEENKWSNPSFSIVDCGDKAELTEWISVDKLDIVINCAAKVTGIVYNERHHATMALENARLAVAPLMACLELDIARYVYVSSACVYPAESEVPTEEFWGWRGSPEPTNYGYGLAKRFGEQLCMLAKDEYPWFQPLVLRPSNMYSPRENFDDENAHVIPRVVRRILDGEDPLMMRGTGSVRRSFLHAKDAARGLLLATMTNHSGILNLPAAARDECTISGLVEMVLSAARQHTAVVFTGKGADGYPQRFSSHKELNRILRDAGLEWHHEISLDAGLKEVVDTCKEHLSKKT